MRPRAHTRAFAAAAAVVLASTAVGAQETGAERLEQEELTGDDDLDALFDDGLDDLLSGAWTGDDASDDGLGTTTTTTVKGFVETRARTYTSARGRSGFDDEQVLFEGELEVDFDFEGPVSAYFRPRFRVDLVDEDLERFEPFEGYVTYDGGDWDLRGGQFVENWGIADTYNPIDVVNRRDFASDLLDADRLGEMGVRYRKHFEGGETFGEPTASLYFLPVFRTTPFPTKSSRFTISAPGLAFDSSPAITPEGSERFFYAARGQSTLETSALSADLQVLVAHGPERFPLILPTSASTVAPYYYGTTTIGGGLRMVPDADALGDFLSTLTIKAEVVYKSPYRFDGATHATPEDYLQYVLGVDRVLPNVLLDNDQTTLTLEYAGETGASDTDPAAAIRPFRSDFIVRAFWEQNDFSRTSVDARAILDTDLDERIYEAIFERQLRLIHDDLKWFVHVQVFDADDDEGLFSLLPDNTSIALGARFDL